MKKIILLTVLFTFIEISAQTTRPANLEIPITVSDNSYPPYSSITLFIGLDSAATDGIDPILDESALPCLEHFFMQTDCPPTDHFGAALILPPFSGDTISFKDFRYGYLPFTGEKQHQLAYQAHSTATEVLIEWEFPQGATGVMQDIFGLVTIQMIGSGSYSIPQQYINILTRFWVNMTYDNVVPAELISFTSEILQNEKAIQLNWTTATETNNSGFEVERLKDLPDGKAGWEAIGFVPGFGTTIEPKSYSFIDKDVMTGIYKYRLKQIDFDGTFTYSNEIEVEVDFTPKEFVLDQNYPNPFNPTTTIKYEIPLGFAASPFNKVGTKGGFVTLKVYDGLGNEVVTLVNEEKQPGVYEVEFNASSLASGMYLYKLQAGNFIRAKKMILAK